MASIDSYLTAAETNQGSDIFLREGDVPRIKINGELMMMGEEPLGLADMAALWQACSGDPMKDTDVDTGVTSESGTRYRVNLHKSMGRLAAVLRRIKMTIPTLEELGLPAALLQGWGSQKNGLILVTGPTGSGKSTSLASILEWINLNKQRHIVTIEDPIEYLFEDKGSLFTQREVGRDTDSFPQGLRAAMRQAPDIIMLGEIRDGSSAMSALSAAETGHLVLGTLHCERVTETFERLINLFSQDHRAAALQLMSTQLLGIICQKLMPGAKGGLCLVTEYLENQGATREWIRGNQIARIQDFLESNQNPNNRPFLKSIVEEFQAGNLSEENAIAASGNEVAFRRAVRGIS